MIKDYFLNYEGRNNDFTVTLGADAWHRVPRGPRRGHWRVTVAYTGEETMTGGRVNRVGKYLGDERFICTYGDGLADVDIPDLLRLPREPRPAGDGDHGAAPEPLRRHGRR